VTFAMPVALPPPGTYQVTVHDGPPTDASVTADAVELTSSVGVGRSRVKFPRT